MPGKKPTKGNTVAATATNNDYEAPGNQDSDDVEEQTSAHATAKTNGASSSAKGKRAAGIGSAKKAKKK